jgi:hypothetical protein
MAVAVLTPRNNDLESGTWTRAAPLTRLTIIREGISEKEKTQRLFASNENKMSDGGRERASLGVEMWKSSQKWSVRRSAVRSIAWLDALDSLIGG